MYDLGVRKQLVVADASRVCSCRGVDPGRGTNAWNELVRAESDYDHVW